jgi:DNA-directed RNA polymerase specialized sigma24 family protein
MTYDAREPVYPDHALGFTCLLNQWGEQIGQRIRQVARGLLSREDLEDTCQETVRASWIWFRSKRRSDEESLRVMLTIAYRKAIDAVRRSRHRPKTNTEDALATLEDYSHAGAGNTAWGQQIGDTECQELLGAIQEALAELPEPQRLVAQVYLEYFEEFGPRATYRRLTELVSGVTGQPEKVATIKNHWHAAQETIAECLRRRGYDLKGQPR